MIPRATYRLQFHEHFTFADAEAHADYFAALGISHIYASPVTMARAHSLHGYDVVDPGRINPELGGEDGLRKLIAALHARQMGFIADIVPNHVAVGGADNPWWLDVLAKGRESRFAHYFDVDWDTPELTGKILAPFLDGSPESCLEDGTLRLQRLGETGEIAFAYYEHRFPLREEDQKQLSSLDNAALAALDIHPLLENQHFRLADWRQANAHINWRRFFDITGLAAVRVEQDDVFEAVHAAVLPLYAEGLIDGFRIDHIDGLSDPKQYCRSLRARLDALEPQRPASTRNGRAYLIVEKICASDEMLPSDWDVDGTTGYDFMAEISALQHRAGDEDRLGHFWAAISGRDRDFEPEEHAARLEILADNFGAQWRATARAFAAVAPANIAIEEIHAAIAALIGNLRAYRSYATGREASPGAGPYLTAASQKAASHKPHLSKALQAILHIVNRKDDNPAAVDAIRRFHQLSAPVAAKAVEDTAFYRYGRLLSRNDVGFDPKIHALSVTDFHARIQKRMYDFPNTMLTTATHDHKRGEDARARLAVLSERDSLWQEKAEHWLSHPAIAQSNLDSGDCYQLLQTLVGVWDGAPDLEERIAGWCEKFLREGKLRSNWTTPDGDYESRFKKAATSLLHDGPFVQDLDNFVRSIEPSARCNSILQIIARYTLPGVPDLYRGCEDWDHSMVDPDNRRPVDWRKRQGAFPPGESPLPVWNAPDLKTALLVRLLSFRRQNEALFKNGDYLPLYADGPRAGHLVAYSRSSGGSSLCVVALRHSAGAMRGGGPLPDRSWWQQTAVRLPPAHYVELFTGRTMPGGRQELAAMLSHFPAAIFFAE